MTRYFIILICLFTSINYSFSQDKFSNLSDTSAYNLSVDSNYYVIVDQNATFQNGDINKFRLYVSQNVSTKNISDTVDISPKMIFRFGIDWNGQVKNVERLTNNNVRQLESSIQSLIQNSHGWIPAVLNKKRVGQSFVLAIIVENIR
jgi:hypothetical protein